MNALAQQISQMSPLKVALATQQLASKMSLMNAEPIAVIGMACRFPGGANNPDLYWQLLSEGRDAVIEIPAERWDNSKFYDADPAAPGKMTVRHGGFLKDVDKFDAQFFGISPREAAVLDPQQRLLLEVSWEALENAGIVPASLHNSATGVYVGITTSEYERVCQHHDISLHTDNTHIAYMGTGNDTCAASGRLSYSLGLTGPSMSVNTACSSSLVAAHLACDSLRHRTSNLAIAGGVNLTLIPDVYVIFSKAGMLSPGGKCRTFDASADGYVRGEGCGILILKRYSDAVADGDKVLALIRGSAVNQDGRSSGLTVPNGPSQQAVIRQALKNSGISPDQVSYLEAHGTGTALGDPIEVGAIGEVFGEQREHPLLIGSAKTNIGHLESGAGAAGLIKTILALKHGEIPPSLHFTEPSPHIAWDKLPLKVVTERCAWPTARRIAGVSSFGYSGTNSHFVLEAAPILEKIGGDAIDRPMHILALSAKTKDALASMASDYGQAVQNDDAKPLADFCWTANTRRSLFTHRLAVAASTKTELAEQLAAFAGGSTSTALTSAGMDSRPAKTAFLFTGQGSQYIGMGRELYATQPTFRDALALCDQLLQPYLQHALLDVLFPERPSSSAGAELINETAYTQPALFALEYALATLWQSWGIQPEVMIGHSVGEYAAACIAGVFSLEDGLRLIAARGRLMQALPPNGGMLAVRADENRVAEVIQPFAATVSLAASNGPQSVVISGELQALQTLAEQFKQHGVETRPLTVSHAFHSPLMEPMLAEFAKIAKAVSYQAPKIGIVSNLTGKLVTTEMSTADYWVRHVREAVRFNAGMTSLEALGCNVYLEIGPQPTLLGMGRQCLTNDTALYLPSLRTNRSDWSQMLESLAGLFARGLAVDWQAFDADYTRQITVTPTYPFQRQRHWSQQTPQVKNSADSRLRPLVDTLLQSPLLKETIVETTFSTAALPYLNDHKVFDEVLVPGAAYIATVLSGAELLGMTACRLEDVVFTAPLVLPEEHARIVQVLFLPDESVQTAGGLQFSFQVVSTDQSRSESEMIQHATGYLASLSGQISGDVFLSKLQADCAEVLSSDDFYQTAQDQQIDFGPGFRWISGLWGGEKQALAQINLPESIVGTEGYWLHPGLLDACFQAAGATLDESASTETLLPFMLKNLQVYAVPKGSSWWCHVLEVAKNTWDIKLLSATGQLLAELSGFEMRNVPRGAALNRKLSDWLYQLEWQAKPLLERNFSEAAGRWLIIDGADSLGAKLAVSLQAVGLSSVVVNSAWAYQVVAMSGNLNEPQHLLINTEHLADFQRLFTEVFIEPAVACLGVIYLAAVETSQDQMPETAQSLSLQILYLSQSLAQAKLNAKLWLVTQGAQQVSAESQFQLAQAVVWGFGRTLAIEQPDLDCVCLDLSPAANANQLGELMAELGGNDGEEQVAWRDGNRYAARLAHYQDPERQLPPQPAGPFRLELADYGSPDELHLVPLNRRQPGPNEVEIEVKAAALNFRDVLNSLGMLKDYYAEVLSIKQAKDVRLGFECAGTVVAVGADVIGLKIGDEVLAITEGSFASYVTVDAGVVAKKPGHIGFEAASGIPTAYLTAYYGLYELAKLQPGDKVLVHAAAGGVGQAAVQLAQALGAEVFATASPGKWDTLKAQGVKHVMNSRTLDFADEILRLTVGAGVDVVLNSLNGEFIDKSFEALAQGGRFVEIGKIGIWEPERVTELRPDAAYFPFDLGEANHAQPGLMTTMLSAVVEGFNQRKLSALPQTVFPVNDAANAYRFMQQAKHFGKVVLSFNTDTQPAIQPESSYIVTGGLGALGLLVAKQLVEQGAQHLVLAGRGGAVNASGQDLLDSLTAQGVAISIVAADVAKAEDVSRLIEIAQVKFPLRGIIHAAGVIDDAGLEKQTAERFARVMAPKAQGAWHLHKQTQHLQLDFFICFSSISSLMGSPGQCNYSAANAVVDLLMQQRHSQGLPGMSINWGPWAEVGMAANLSFADEGLDKIAPATGMQILADLMRRPAQHSPAQIGVFTINWPLFIKQFPAGQEPLFISKMLVAKTAAMKKSAPSSDIRQQLQNAAPDERPALLNNYIDAQLTQVLSLDASQSTPFDQHWRELGLDSLMTVELKNRLNRSLGVSIPLETIMQDATTRLLAEMVAQRLEDSLASDSFAGASEDRDSGSAEDSYAKNQAALDADVAMLALIPQAYVNVDEQRERQVLIDGRWRCDFASCNYLGMDLHPEVINSIPAALDKWGVHPSWTRAVASPGLYPELEQELADLLGAPETLAYPSIHLLHLGVLPMLAGFNGVILKDNAAHHSIYEACLRAQADGVEWLEFAHNDLADLEKKLARYRPEQSKIIAIDGVYSMSGEFPPLPEMSALAKKYNALIYVDDAHGVGVIGANPTEDMPYGFGGCGIVKYFGLGYEEDRIIYVGGLSKSFSSYGAFITCFDKAMKSRLSLTGPFVFSGPSPVASLASALSGLKVNRREGDQMRRQVYKLTHKLVTSAKAMGFEVDNEHDFPIVGVVIGNIDQVTEACNMLWEYDILITPAIYPAVAMHRNLVRFSITAANTEAEIDQAISGLQAVWDQIVTKQALSA